MYFVNDSEVQVTKLVLVLVVVDSSAGSVTNNYQYWNQYQFKLQFVTGADLEMVHFQSRTGSACYKDCSYHYQYQFGYLNLTNNFATIVIFETLLIKVIYYITDEEDERWKQGPQHVRLCIYYVILCDIKCQINTMCKWFILHLLAIIFTYF